MFTIPEIFKALLEPFSRLFSAQVWHHAQVLLVGALLSPAERTVAAAMRVMGLSQDKHLIDYQRVLSRAVWSSRKASQILLLQLIAVFATSGVIVLGLDDTIERRRGKQIAAKGIYRAPVRSSHEHFVMREWIALVELDVVGRHSLGWACLGTAISECISTVRAI